MDDFSKAPPTNINPYKVLLLQPTATPTDIKSAYRKLALHHHPDKAPPDAKDTAHTKFQEIAFAYAILSDERRRKRYDTTGNTSESLDADDDDFNWSDFFRAQWAEAVTGERLESFKTTYQGSEEEKRDVLKAYAASKGKLNAVFRSVMLSNPLDDEDRFRGYIDQAIEEGEVEAYNAYTNESKKTRDERHRRARKEAKEAEQHAKESGIHESIFGDGDSKVKKSGKKDDVSALADLIQQRNKSRATSFLDDLEAKYAGGKKGATDGKKGKKRGRDDEPSEEAFQKVAENFTQRKAANVDEDVEMEPEDATDEPASMTKGPKTKSNTKTRKTRKHNVEPPQPSSSSKPSTRARKPKPPVVDEPSVDDDDEEVDLDVSSTASEPEVSEPETPPKEKAPAKTRSSKRTKR